MTTITATSILASRHALDPKRRIDTLLLRYPRCIHSEFMTHRVFSRNASSSRAIPVSKLIQDVIDDPFIPLFWGKNQKGMQAGEDCNELVEIWSNDNKRYDRTRESAWHIALEKAVEMARAFSDAGYHKQIVNRLLEPFSHITVVVTSTQWSNFLALRDHPDAEPHIRVLAQRVREALDGADVQVLQPGQWHVPFVSSDDWALLDQDGLPALASTNNAIKLSVARCASTSYKTVEGFDMTLERAIALTDKLIASEPLHASPCEHQAQAAKWRGNGIDSRTAIFWDTDLSGNLGPGWVQFRKTLPNECL